MPGTRPGMTETGAAPSSLNPALDRLLDDLLGGLWFRFLVAGLTAQRDMHPLVDQRDQQDEKANRITELQNPQRHDHDALRHVAEFPRLPVHMQRVVGKEADEGDAQHQREHLEVPALSPLEEVDDQADADHLAVPEGVDRKSTRL